MELSILHKHIKMGVMRTYSSCTIPRGVALVCLDALAWRMLTVGTCGSVYLNFCITRKPHACPGVCACISECLCFPAFLHVLVHVFVYVHVYTAYIATLLIRWQLPPV